MRAGGCARVATGLGSEQHLGDAVQSSECARAAGEGGGWLAICYPSHNPDRGSDPLPTFGLDEVTCLGPGTSDNLPPSSPGSERINASLPGA